MKKDRYLTFLGILIFTVVTAAVAFYGINRFYLLRVKEVSAEFDFQCAQSYRYTETLKSGVVVSYPMQKEYNDCVSSKGKLN